MIEQVIVMAHGAAQAAFNRHLPFWEAHELPITVICPENDPVSTEHALMLEGKAEHNGRHSLDRLERMLQTCVKRDAVIYEYDSFSLSPELPEACGLHGNIHSDENQKHFSAPRFATPPWTLCQRGADKMLCLIDDFPDIYEQGEADRWLSYVAWLAGVPVQDFRPKGFSAVWIRGDNFNRAKSAILDGAVMIHGIKAEDWLRKLEGVYKILQEPLNL